MKMNRWNDINHHVVLMENKKAFPGLFCMGDGTIMIVEGYND